MINKTLVKEYTCAAKPVIIGTLGISAFLCAQAPLAVGQDKSRNIFLEEITVTAQFKSQNAQDTPLAITAVTSELIEARSVSDVVGIADWVPNVQLSRGGDGGFGQMASVYIRGVGQSDIHFAVEPGVGMYIDDVYYGVMSGAVFRMMDTDRVEVLRGPQGTLAGKNSIGGAMKIFSARPGPEADGYAEFSIGEFDRISGRAASNFTLIEDKLYARASVASRRRDGYLDRRDYACATGDTSLGATQRQLRGCKIGTQGGEDVMMYRASLLWTPSDGIENLFMYDAVEDNSENPAAKLTSQNPLWAGSADFFTGEESYSNYENNVSTPSGSDSLPAVSMPDTSPLDAWGVTNNLHIELTDSMTLTSITGYRESNVAISQQLDSTPASIIDQFWFLSHEQFSQELRLSGGNHMFDWTVGAYYYTADGTSEGRVIIPGGLAPGGGGLDLDILFKDPVETESKSVFAHAVWHLGNSLNVTTAIRYTDDEKEFTFNRLDTATGGPHATLGSLYDLTSAFEGERTDYRVVLDYTWNGNLMSYAQFATGYKGGGINPRPYVVAQAVPFEEEELDSFELGMKADMLDGRIRVNAAAFYNEYTNFQATLQNCGSISPAVPFPCTATFNVGDAEIRGFEMETVFQITDNLTAELTAGILDFDYTMVDTATGITLDSVNVYTPEKSGALGVSYSIDLGGGGTLTPRIDWTYRGEMQTNPVNNEVQRLDSVDIVNAKLQWESATGDWQASFTVTNLTDEFYYESTNGRPNAPYFTVSKRPGWPREWFLTVSRNF